MSLDGLKENFHFRALKAVTAEHLRPRIILLFTLLTLRGCSQVFGILSVVPLIALVAEPDLLWRDPMISRVAGLLGLKSQKVFVTAVGLSAVMVICLTHLIRVFSTWYQRYLAGQIRTEISSRLLAGYLLRSYEISAREHYADLSRNLGETSNVAALITVLANLYAQVVVTLTACIVLFILRPVETVITIALLLPSYGAAFWTVKNRLFHLGRERTRATRKLARLVYEGLTGLRDWKLGNKEQIILFEYRERQTELSATEARSEGLSVLPSLVLDLLGVLTMIVLILILYWQELESAQLWSSLALVFVCFYRVLPAVKDIFLSSTRLKSLGASLEIVASELAKVQADGVEYQEQQTAITFEQAITLQEVDFTYQSMVDSRGTLKGINLSIPKNSCTAIVGPTGSGKSTLLNILMGLYRPNHGHVAVDGNLVTPQNLRAWRRLISLVPQDVFFLDATLADNVALASKGQNVDREKCSRALSLAKLDDFLREGFSEGLDTRVEEQGRRLSGGQKQRLGIARALYQEPKILFLDEATSALDSPTEGAILEGIQSFGGDLTLVLVTHRLSTVRACHNIILLDQGQIVDTGSFEHLMESNSLFRTLVNEPTLSFSELGN